MSADYCKTDLPEEKPEDNMILVEVPIADPRSNKIGFYLGGVRYEAHLKHSLIALEYTAKIARLKAEEKKQGWISVKERLPDENVSVLVFIPEEDEHITSGMWDVSQKWVLLDEYRVPKSEVTYWQYGPEKPDDRSYTPSKVSSDELETMTETISRLQKRIYELEHPAKN